MPEETPKTEETPRAPATSSTAPETPPAPEEEKGEEEPTELTEGELNTIQPGKASPLDPDFLLIFFVALIADLAIDPFIETIGLPTIILPILNRVLDVINFLLIGGWIYWKSKQFVVPAKLAQRIKKMEAKVMAKIQAKIAKKVSSKALRKALIRVIPAIGIEFTPGLAVFTSWVAAVISMVF